MMNRHPALGMKEWNGMELWKITMEMYIDDGMDEPGSYGNGKHRHYREGGKLWMDLQRKGVLYLRVDESVSSCCRRAESRAIFLR